MESTEYHPPVSKLLTYGEPELHEWPDYLNQGLGPDDVPELIRMATDPALNEADSESLEVWAPTHAWRALGQLRAGEAVEPLLRLLSRSEDDDWASEELPHVLGEIGPAAIPALSRYLDGRHELRPLGAAGGALEEVAKRHPEARDEVVAVLTQKLERFDRQDAALNAYLIANLLELHATEAAPLMERAFAANRVDLSVSGDWEEVQIELGLRAERETPPPLHGWLFAAPPEPALAPVRKAAPALVVPRSAGSGTSPKAKAKAKRKDASRSRRMSRKK